MWQDMFDLQVSAGERVLRAILIYLFLIAILRIVGKRELGDRAAPGFADLGAVKTAILETKRRRGGT